MRSVRMDRVLGPCIAALLVVPLCACSKFDGHANGKSPAVASSTAPGPATASSTNKVLVTTLAALPGHPIAKTQGFDCRFFLWNGKGNYVNKFQGALYAFRTEAAKHGADAIVNLRISAIPFAKSKSAGTGSVVNLCGDEVKFRHGEHSDDAWVW